MSDPQPDDDPPEEPRPTVDQVLQRAARRPEQATLDVVRVLDAARREREAELLRRTSRTGE